ncbi:putative 4-hydroxy-tetrahydrodipicolinate synthase, chloroplastic-like [Capsicum annuum]|nr:putative 4-hydroxy-tetrahydrodipicolinate synthase, chloroplastic-like [Capsicum annuum]
MEKRQSRRSTQKRQKQFFEQRKWHEQQKKDARESFFEEKTPCYQPEKNSRSLDILSLLNLSTGSGEHKSNVHSGTSPSYQDDAACPQNTSVGAPGGHEKALYSTDHKENPLTNSTSKQLSIIDILGDDGPNCELGSSTHEGHVAFSFEGLGKVEMSTPVHSPQQPGRAVSLESYTPDCFSGTLFLCFIATTARSCLKTLESAPSKSAFMLHDCGPFSYGRSSCPRARRKGLSSDYLNRGIYGIELELVRALPETIIILLGLLAWYMSYFNDRMMVDVELPFRTSPLDGSSCSRGIPDLPGSAEHKLPDTKWFSFNNNFTYLHAFENDEIFGKSKESSNTIWNAYSSFPLPESFHEDCGSLPKSHLYHLDAGSTDFWNCQSCGRRAFYFEDCYYWNSANSCSARNNEKQGTCFDDSYHQNQRVRMRAKAEFNIIDSPTSYSKHFKPENFSVSDGEWYSMGCASPHLMDYIDHADMTWFANEDARDNLSLLRLLFEALSAYWSLFWAFILLMN